MRCGQRRIPLGWVLAALVLLPRLAAGADEALPQAFWPRPPATPRIVYRGEISGPKPYVNYRDVSRRDEQRLILPHDVAVDPWGRIYVTDGKLAAVFRWDLENNKFTVIGNGPDQLQAPYFIAIDGDGSVYVSDLKRREILVFDKDGRYLFPIGRDSDIERPGGLAVDRERKRLIVADTPRHQVHILDLNGKPVHTIGKYNKDERAGSSAQGEFYWPGFVAVDRVGKIYVSDYLNFRVQVFSPQGRFVNTFGQNGDGPGSFHRPRGIAVDNQGNIWVVDSAFGNVQVFDQALRLLTFFGQPGIVGPGETKLPTGLAFDGKNRFYLVDQGNSRVQVFQFLSPLEGEKLKNELMDAGKFNAPPIDAQKPPEQELPKEEPAGDPAAIKQ